ncbi:MAG: hypothetical protein ABIO80_04380 [Sphingomicrobium sp.]
MAKILILLPMLLSATPALAQPAPPQLPRELTDPATADRLARAMHVMSRSLLNLPVGELQAALDGRAATAAEKKLTVRDIARRDDPDFDRRVAQGIDGARPMIDRSMKTLNTVLPSMMQALRQTQDALDRATANLPDPTYPRR